MHTRQGGVWPNRKGVHREVESEGSRRQNAGLTNRNHIEAAMMDRTTTVTIKDVGTTEVEVPDDAKKKLP
jgi:hypothetical protein